jgi:hypothetical protein
MHSTYPSSFVRFRDKAAIRQKFFGQVPHPDFPFNSTLSESGRYKPTKIMLLKITNA